MGYKITPPPVTVSGGGYMLDGVALMRVTSIVDVLDKPGLVWWSADMAGKHIAETLKPGTALTEDEIAKLAYDATRAHKAAKDMAADKGGLAHEWIEAYLLGRKPAMPKDPQVANSVDLFLSWQTDHSVEWLAVEMKIGDSKLGIGGKLDAIAVVDGDLTLVDHKTGKGVYEGAYLQTAAYAKMAQPCVYGGALMNRLVLHLPREGGLNAIWLKTDLEDDWKGFLACLNLVNWRTYFKAVTGAR